MEIPRHEAGGTKSSYSSFTVNSGSEYLTSNSYMYEYYHHHDLKEKRYWISDLIA